MNTMKKFVVGIFLFCGLLAIPGGPLPAQTGVPGLQQVLDEGVAACKLLLERGKADDDLDVDVIFARGQLTFVLVRVGRRDDIDGLHNDAEEKRSSIESAEYMLVEATGELPKLADGMAPLDELRRRQSFAVALAKRGDFERACEQIEAFPAQRNSNMLEIRMYRLVAERQLERRDLAGARESLRRVRSRMEAVELNSANQLIDAALLAQLCCRAGDQEAARQLCGSAEEVLRKALRESGDDALSRGMAIRELAIAHAMSGNLRPARDLLAEFKPSAGSIRDEQGRAEFLFALEIAEARIAELSGKNDDALAAYARALTSARQIDDELPESLARFLGDSEFLHGLFSLSIGSHLRTIALGQLKAGDRQAAMATWEQMPVCYHKPSSLVEMAKVLHESGATGEARRLADRCAAIERPDFTAKDHVAITAFVAGIYRAIEDEQAVRRVLEGLVAERRVKESVEAKKLTATNLIDFGLHAEAYSLIQTIDSPAERALPLARLADALVKQAE